MTKTLKGVFILFFVLVIGCEEDTKVTPDIEVYYGELSITRTKDWLPWTDYFTDTVSFTVEGNEYRLIHQTRASTLCDSKGIVNNFGTNELWLEPREIDTGNCDYQKVPQGKFVSVFRGDSLYLGPDTVHFSGAYPYTMIYEFKLSK